MNSGLLLTTPLFPYIGWKSIKSIFLRWIKNYRAIFVPLAFYNVCEIRNRKELKLYCRLDKIEELLKNKSITYANKIIDLYKLAQIKGSSIRLIFHTEYQCMIWNWYDLLKVYSEIIITFVNLLKSHGIEVELIELEFHPGFVCVQHDDSGMKLTYSREYLTNVVRGMCELVLNIVQNININLRVTIESRGSSIFGNNIPQIIYETLSLRELINRLREDLNEHGVEVSIGFTADPWQEIGYKYRRYYRSFNNIVRKIFKDIYELIDSGIPVHDVHVHWNAHRVPPREVLDNFLELINKAISFSQGPIFITPEVVRTNSNQLKEFLTVLESLVTKNNIN